MSKQYIDKNKVIIALSHNKCGNDENDIAVQTCIETIKKLPTVELIGREEVLNLIDTAFENGAFDGRYAYENLVDAVQNLIHPLETKALEKEPCDDAVSRQAAINAFERFIHELGINDEPYNYGEMALSAQNVPSVEPEKCRDCISREELKRKFQWLAKATKYGNEDAEQQNFSYSTMMMYEIADMIEDAIDNCQSVEPERKPGHWEWDQRTGEYVCSECGCNPIYEGMTPDVSEIDKYRYCRWCGAPMEVKNES